MCVVRAVTQRPLKIQANLEFSFRKASQLTSFSCFLGRLGGVCTGRGLSCGSFWADSVILFRWVTRELLCAIASLESLDQSIV